MTNPHLAYRPDIDGLRAIAILSVVAFHAFPEWVHGGFVGVDIFFVISGYLISGILLRGLAGGNFSFVEFYARRIRRIFPALTLVLLSCLLFGWFSLFANEYKMLGKHTAASAAFFANFAFASESGYFDTAAELKPLLHLWSLGIEEQFYIFWPALLFLAYRHKFNLLQVTLLITLVSFCLNIGRIENHLTSTFYLPPTRVWELLIGSLLAYINLYKREQFDHFLSQVPRIFDKLQHNTYVSVSNFKSGLGLLLIILSVFALNKNHLFPGWWALPPTAGAFLLISAGHGAWINKRILSSNVLVSIGLISYPLYLWHWPLLSFARIMESGTPSREIRLTAVVLSFFLAWLTYWLLERHVRFRKHWSVPVVLILSLSLAAGLGYNIYSRDGLGFRHKTVESQLEPFKWDKNGLDRQDDCTNYFQELGQQYCLRSGNKPPSVALIGDSHANHLFYGLANFYARSGQGLLNLGFRGCPPFYNLESWLQSDEDMCKGRMNLLLDYILKEPGIKTVVLSGAWARYTSGTEHGNERRANDLRLKLLTNPQNQDNLDIFGQAMEQTLKQLLGAGKEIIFVIDTPELGFDPKTCVDYMPMKLTSRVQKTPCAIAKTEFEKRSNIYRTKVAEILYKFPTVKLWDTSKSLCDDQYCWVIRDGKILFRDSEHLSLDGSHYLGEHFTPK